MATLLTIAQRFLLPEGANSGKIQVIYPEPYRGAALAAGGMYEGRLVLITGREFEARAADGTSPFKVYGASIGDRLPEPVTVRVIPEGPNVAQIPIEFVGHPRDTSGTNAATWDLSRIGSAQGELYTSADFTKDITTLITEGRAARDQAAAAASAANAIYDNMFRTVNRAQAIMTLSGEAMQNVRNYNDLVAESTVPGETFGRQWRAIDISFSVLPGTLVGLNYAYVATAVNGPQRWGISYLDLPSLSKGIIRQTFAQENCPVNDAGIGLCCKMQGSDEKEVGVVARLDIRLQQLRLFSYTYVNGAVVTTELVTAIPFACVQGQAYTLELAFGETWYGFKAWKVGELEPSGYLLTAESNVVTGTGRVGAVIRGGRLIMGSRSFTYAYSIAQAQSPTTPVTTVATEPRGNGGTLGRLTWRQFNTFNRQDLLLDGSEPLEVWDIDGLALIDATNKPITPGEVGDVTGLPGYETVGPYYAAPPQSATGPNLVPVPNPLPSPDWPVGYPKVWNVKRPFGVIGSVIADGTKRYFKMENEIYPALTDTPAPPDQIRLSIATLPLSTDLYASNDIVKLLQTGTATASPPNILADTATTITPSPTRRMINGVDTGVYLRIRPFGSYVLDVLPLIGQRLTGEMLTTYQVDTANFEDARPSIIFGASGSMTAGVAGAHWAVRHVNGQLVLHKVVTTGRTEGTSSTIATANTGFTAAANTIYNLRTRVNADLTVNAKVWPLGSAEPATWQLTSPVVADLVAGYWGIRQRNAIVRYHGVSFSPEGTASHAD